jgi:hypothetical protein
MSDLTVMTHRGRMTHHRSAHCFTVGRCRSRPAGPKVTGDAQRCVAWALDDYIDGDQDSLDLLQKWQNWMSEQVTALIRKGR